MPDRPADEPQRLGLRRCTLVKVSNSTTLVSSSPRRTSAAFTKPDANSRKVDLRKLHYEAKNGNCDIRTGEYTGPVRTEILPGQGSLFTLLDSLANVHFFSRIQDLDDLGHRIVATQDAPKGTLLLVSKSVAAVKNADDTDTYNRLTLAVMRKLRRYPQKLIEVYKLEPESQFSGAALPGMADHGKPVSMKKRLDKPDYKSIRAICKRNAMSPSIDFDAVPLNYLIDDVSDDNPPRITGLWLLPSCFRHSCLGQFSKRASVGTTKIY